MRKGKNSFESIKIERVLHPAGEDGGEAWNNTRSTHQQHTPQKAKELEEKIEKEKNEQR